MADKSKRELSPSRKRRAFWQGIAELFDFTGLAFPVDMNINTDMDLESLPKIKTPDEIIAESWRVVGDNLRQAIEGYGRKHGPH